MHLQHLLAKLDLDLAECPGKAPANDPGRGGSGGKTQIMGPQQQLRRADGSLVYQNGRIA